MKSSNVILGVVGVGLLVIASQFAQGQPAADPAPMSILSKLEVGMHVRLTISGNGAPFYIGVISDKEAEAAKGNDAEAARIHPIYTITEVGTDYFVVRFDNGTSAIETTIPLHSIGSMNRHFALVAK